MLIFDMDGTLIDSNGIWRDVDTAFLAKRGLPYTREYYEGVAHTVFPRRRNLPNRTAASPNPPTRSWRSGWRWPATSTPPAYR